MVTTTLQLEDEVYRRLEDEARQRGIKPAELLRNLVTSMLGARREEFVENSAIRRELAFRDHLCSAPLEGIDLRRSREAGRPIDL